MSLRWYAARTQPRAELLAAAQLDRDGFEVYSPRVRVTDSHLASVELPLFPGYLFIRCDLETENVPTFRSTHRILGWINFDGDIPWLPDEVVSDIQSRAELINLEGGVRIRFKPGELVQIISDTFQGIGEVVEDAKTAESKVKVLLEFLGRSVPALVPWALLKPLEDTHKEYQRSSGPISRRLPRRTRGKGRRINNMAQAATGIV